MNNRSEVIEDAYQILIYLSEYKVLKLAQVDRLLSHKPESVRRSIIRYLVKNNRAYIIDDLISATEDWEEGYDKARIEAFWIFIDYMEDALYNAVSEFPTQLTFTTSKNDYIVAVAEKGQEAMLCSYLKKISDKSIKIIVSVRDEDQIKELDCPYISGYCTVSKQGYITYYKANRGYEVE